MPLSELLFVCLLFSTKRVFAADEYWGEVYPELNAEIFAVS